MGSTVIIFLKILRYLVDLRLFVVLGILDHKKRIIPNRILIVTSRSPDILLAVECLVFPEVWVELFLSSMTDS